MYQTIFCCFAICFGFGIYTILGSHAKPDMNEIAGVRVEITAFDLIGSERRKITERSRFCMNE